MLGGRPEVVGLYRPYLHISVSKIRRVNREGWKKEVRQEYVLLELPLSVIERTDVPRLEPPGDAVEVERVLFVR